MLDLSKPVQTRDGWRVRILCKDLQSESGGYPIVAAVSDPEGNHEHLFTYTSEGRYLGGVEKDHRDLVNIPERTAQYFHVFKDTSEGTYPVHVWNLEEFARLHGPQYPNYLRTIVVTLEDEQVVDVTLENWEAKD